MPNITTPQGKFISVKGLCAYMGIGRSTAYEYLGRGVIPKNVIVHLGGRVLIDREKLDEFLAQKAGVDPDSAAKEMANSIYNERTGSSPISSRKG